MRIQKQNSGVGIAFHWEERSPYRPRLDFQFLGLRGQQMLDRKRGKKSDGTEPVQECGDRPSLDGMARDDLGAVPQGTALPLTNQSTNPREKTRITTIAVQRAQRGSNLIW